MPFAIVKGIGRIKVKKRVPKSFPKRIRIGNKTFKTDREAQRVIFIRNNLAKGESTRLRKKFIREAGR